MTAEQLRASLEETFHEKIPITQAMGIRVVSYDRTSLVLSAPLGPNVNDKGAAFGGSLYSLLVLAGWGLLHLRLKEEKIQGDVMIHKCDVTYSQPVGEDWRAECILPEQAEYARFIAELKARKRGRIRVDVRIKNGGRTAVSFSGSYAAIRTDA